jgi:hypothetical protein
MADGELSSRGKGVVTLNNIKNWNNVLKIKKDNDVSDLVTRLKVYKRYTLFGIVHLYICGLYSPKNSKWFSGEGEFVRLQLNLNRTH